MASAQITHPLPEDIVEDILARLAVKSLKRFMCVGKSWFSLIQNPQFISAHYSFSKNKVYPLVKHRKYEYQKQDKNVLSIISNQTFDIVANLDTPAFIIDKRPSVSIRGIICCNGIICLSYYNRDVVLWNIATKEFKTLPICPFEFPPDFNNSIEVVCLGYDSKKDDYKVIRIDSFWNKHDYSEYEVPIYKLGKRVALYNLSSNSWRKLNANLSLVEFGIDFRGSQCYSNGFVHRLASVENENALLSFDMSSEVFVTTPLPDGAKKSIFHMEIIGSVGGICHVLWRTEGCYEGWVLGEVGVKNSWINIFTIGPVFNVQRPLGVGCDGEIFFESKSEHNFLVWHHPSNREIKAFQIQGSNLEVAMYAESLVSLRGGSIFHD